MIWWFMFSCKSIITLSITTIQTVIIRLKDILSIIWIDLIISNTGYLRQFSALLYHWNWCKANTCNLCSHQSKRWIGCSLLHKPTFLLKTVKAWPQALHTSVGLPELVGGYVEYPALGANLNGPAPAPNPGCWPLTAPVPMTSFKIPQHEAHTDEAPAWREEWLFTIFMSICDSWWLRP